MATRQQTPVDMMSPILVPYKPEWSLGCGVDPATLRSVPGALWIDKENDLTPESLLLADRYFSVFRTSKEYSKMVRRSMSASFNGFGVSVSASSISSEEVDYNSERLGFVAGTEVLSRIYKPKKFGLFGQARFSKPEDLQNYDEFVGEFYTHFFGGFVTGGAYKAHMTLLFASKSDQKKTADKISADIKKFDAGVGVSDSFETNVTKASSKTTIVCRAHSEGGIPNVPSATDSESFADPQKLLDNFQKSVQTAGGNRLYALLYDWRVIPWVQKQVRHQTPGASVPHRTLNRILREYMLAQELRDKAQAYLNGGSYPSKRSKTQLEEERNELNRLIDSIRNMPREKMAMLDPDGKNFETFCVKDETIESVLAYCSGMARIKCSFTADESFTLPLKDSSEVDALPSNFFQPQFKLKKTSGGEEWWFGFTYRADTGLEAALGLAKNGNPFATKWQARAAEKAAPGSQTISEAVLPPYRWIKASASFK